MADIQCIDNMGPNHQNWPELVSKTVGDLYQTAKTEVELLRLSLRRLIEAQTEKIAGILFLLVACVLWIFILVQRSRSPASFMAGLVVGPSDYRRRDRGRRRCAPAKPECSGKSEKLLTMLELCQSTNSS